jgi:hypothetical protein
LTELQIGLAGIALLFALLATSMPVGLRDDARVLGVFAVVVNVPAALHVPATTTTTRSELWAHGDSAVRVHTWASAFHTHHQKLFDAAQAGAQVRGGLAMATVGACTALGAICGPGRRRAATMAAVAPAEEMKRYKYHPGFAAGAVAAGGSIGMMIPPSIVFIVYGVMTEQSIGKLFIAGIVPGLLIAALFAATIALACALRPGLAPAATATSWRNGSTR